MNLPPGNGGRLSAYCAVYLPSLSFLTRPGATPHEGGGSRPRASFRSWEANPRAPPSGAVSWRFVDAAHRGPAFLSFCRESVSDAVSAPARWPFLPSSFTGWIAMPKFWVLSQPHVPGRHTAVLPDALCFYSVKGLDLCHERYCFVSFFVLFLVLSLSGFGIGWHKLHKVHLEVFPPHLIFWKSLWKNGVHSSLNIWCNSAPTPTGPGYLFIGSFKITDSISFIVLGIFKLSVVHGRFVVVYIFSIHLVLSCQIYVYGVVHNGLSLSFGCLQSL